MHAGFGLCETCLVFQHLAHVKCQGSVLDTLGNISAKYMYILYVYACTQGC